MGDEDIKLNVHYGGSMEKLGDESYIYMSELGSKTVFWNKYEIRWDKFQELLRAELITTPIGLLWYKDAEEDMKNVNYACDFDDDLFELRRLGKTGELDTLTEGARMRKWLWKDQRTNEVDLVSIQKRVFQNVLYNQGKGERPLQLQATHNLYHQASQVLHFQLLPVLLNHMCPPKK